MSNYTKGPWQIEENKLYGSLDIVSNDRYFIISSTIDTDIIGERIDKANIKLIAAAPDLLQAVQEFLLVINKSPTALEHYGDAINRGKAAILKAVGV